MSFSKSLSSVSLNARNYRLKQLNVFNILTLFMIAPLFRYFVNQILEFLVHLFLFYPPKFFVTSAYRVTRNTFRMEEGKFNNL